MSEGEKTPPFKVDGRSFADYWDAISWAMDKAAPDKSPVKVVDNNGKVVAEVKATAK